MTLNLEVDLTRYDSTISILPLTVTTRIEDPPSASQPDRNVQTMFGWVFGKKIREQLTFTRKTALLCYAF